MSAIPDRSHHPTPAPAGARPDLRVIPTPAMRDAGSRSQLRSAARHLAARLYRLEDTLATAEALADTVLAESRRILTDASALLERIDDTLDPGAGMTFDADLPDLDPVRGRGRTPERTGAGQIGRAHV